MVNLSPVMPARISPTAAGSSSSGSGIRLIAPPSPPRPGHSDEAWQASVRQLLGLAKSHLGANWPAFVRDVRADRHLLDLWGDPPGPGT